MDILMELMPENGIALIIKSAQVIHCLLAEGIEAVEEGDPAFCLSPFN